MAEFYLDCSAVGVEYAAYADTITAGNWGLPQDGNGRAALASSAAVAIASIDFAGVSCTGTGTVGLLGVTVSSTLNASGSALATAVVTAINASATTVTTTGLYSLPRSAGQQALNRLVWARVDPGLNTRVQVMMRIAGTDWNGETFTTANLTGTPTVVAFAGGANGPFAYLFNAGATVFGRTAGNYGIMSATQVAASLDPGLTNDIIHVRSRRGASDITVTYGNVNLTVTTPTARVRSLLVDNGAIWSGDDGTFTFDFVTTTAFPSISAGGASSTLRWAARKRNGFAVRFTGGSGGMTIQNGGGSYEFCNVRFVEVSATSRIFMLVNLNTIASNFIDCTFEFSGARSWGSLGGSSWLYSQRFTRCDFIWNGIGADVSGIITATSTWGAGGATEIVFSNCNFVVDGGGTFRVVSPISGGNTWVSQYPIRISFEQCSGLSNMSAGMPPPPSGPQAGRGAFFWDDIGNDRQFRYETHEYTIDWLGPGSQPYYAAQLPTGNQISHRVTWEAARMFATRACRVARYGIHYKDTAATKTVTLELLVPSTMVPTKGQVYVLLKYRSGGVVRFQSSAEVFALTAAGLGTALDAGVGLGAWTGVTTGYSSRKISVTTDFAVDTGSEIVAELVIQGPPSSGNHTIIVNPDLILT